MPFDPRNTDPGGMGGYYVTMNGVSETPMVMPARDGYSNTSSSLGGGGDWLLAPPAAAPVSNVAALEAQDQGNFQNPIYVPEWQQKGFPSEEAFLATQQRAMMQNGTAPLPEWRSVSPQVNGAIPGTPGFGGDMASDTNINYMRPGSATDQTMNNMRFNTQASGPAMNTPPPAYFGQRSFEDLNMDPYASVPGSSSYGRTFGEGNGIPFDVERNAAAMQNTYNQRTGQNGALLTSQQAAKDYLAGNVYTTQTKLPPPPLNPDPRNTGGTWTTNPNNPNSYYVSGDVYTGQRRGNPDGVATGFTNTNNLTEDAVTGYLSLENNRSRGLAQMASNPNPIMPPPTQTPPRGPQPNDDPVSPSLPSPKPQPLPPGSISTPILDGAGNQVATKVTLPDGRTVWNIPNKNWDGSFGFPWTPPANFDLPTWLRDKTEGRPAPAQQDALRNRAQSLPQQQQGLGQQIQQQVQQQIQQAIPAAPAMPQPTAIPNAQALRESILQNMPGR